MAAVKNMKKITNLIERYLFENDLTPRNYPKIFDGNIKVDRQQLTSLIGSPRIVTGWFDCSINDLTSLEGIPKKIGRDFDCRHNNITDPYEYRYALFSEINSIFVCDSDRINDIITEYGFDGKDKSKAFIGMKKLQELRNESN